MCYFCHYLGFQKNATPHQSIHCLDRSNTYSKVPMANRLYDKGKLISTASTSLTTMTSRTSRLCCICLDQSANIAFGPCGHITCCGNCGSSVNECPICREKIGSRLKVFFS